MAFPYGFTAADLEERIETVRLNQITGGDDSKIEKAANDVAAELELYAGKYYATPLTPFTAALRMIFLDLWQWRLIFNCQPEWLNTDREGDDNFTVAKRRKELVRWLEGLASADRNSTLPGCTELTTQSTGAGDAWSTCGTPVMTREALLRAA